MDTEAYRKGIKRSTIKRIRWERLFEISLMAYITRELALGYSRGHITDSMMRHVIRCYKDGQYRKAFSGLSLAKVLENLKISISARIAEMNIEDGIRSRTKRRI
jgi:hypothetical protein